MRKFSQEFNTLNFVINESEDILLFAHTRPDGDAVGSCLALKKYLENLGKNADIACFEPFPEYLRAFSEENFLSPENIDLAKYKLIIACDSVERGFEKILPLANENQITALIDHHQNLTIKGDITIIDPRSSSVCEMIYDFLTFVQAEITREIATFLMLGILTDTGMLQHSNTTPAVLNIISDLMKKGAPISKIINTTFNNKKITTLKLWGKAFEKARINQKSGMIISVLTINDIEECQASTDDIAQVASILNTVPGTKFSLILSERGNGIIKGSFRSEEYKNVDVSKMAAEFGGGGHKLASGFEIKGNIVETENGWKIE